MSAAAQAMTQLAVAVRRLREGGVGAFDEAGLAFALSLAERGRALGGEAGRRLVERALERAGRLERAQQHARARAEAELGRLRAASIEPPPEIARAYAAGSYAEAARAAEALLHRARRDRRARGRAWRRAASTPPPAAMTVTEVRAVLEPRAAIVSDRLAGYRESAEAARAELIVAQAIDGAPKQAGPYNPHAVAARALVALADLSPTYLRAYLATLSDLGRLEAISQPSGAKPRRAARPKKKPASRP